MYVFHHNDREVLSNEFTGVGSKSAEAQPLARTSIEQNSRKSEETLFRA